MKRGKDPDGAWQRYEYDAANRLKIVKTDAGATLATYSYGASNQRLKTVDGTSTNTWYVWEGGKVIAEYNTVSSVNVTWQKSYVYLGERLLATESTATALQFHHPDRLGSRLVTNASDGSSAGEQETLPFGTALGAGIAGNNRRFTNYDRSTTTKLDYAVNRTYNAGLGRFTQVDPIGMQAVSLSDPQSLNLYAYCGNDPVNYTDPTGLFLKRLFRFIFKVLAVIAVVIAVLVAPSVGSLIFLGVGALFGLAGWHNGTVGNIARRLVTLGSTNFGSVRTPPINGSSGIGGVSNFLQAQGREGTDYIRTTVINGSRIPIFSTPDLAAISVIELINPRTKRVEYGGRICKLNSGDGYIYTAPRTDHTVNTVDPSSICPGYAYQVVAEYHTHPNDPNFDNERFSDMYDPVEGRRVGDIPRANQLRLPMYLGTPRGRIKVYEPGVGRNGAGRIRNARR